MLDEKEHVSEISFLDYLCSAILVSSLELHYQIIKSSLCVNFYYNNYNLAPSTTLNYISYDNPDLFILITSVDGVLSSWARTVTIFHFPGLITIPLPAAQELLGRGRVPTFPHCRDSIHESKLPPTAQSSCERTQFPSRFRHIIAHHQTRHHHKGGYQG